MFLNALTAFSDDIRLSFLIKLPDSKEIKIGESYGSPAFTVIINNEKGLQALKSGTELKICEAYIYKDIDLVGKVDMMRLLEITKFFSKEYPFLAWWSRLVYLLCDQVSTNQKSIAKHYEFDDDFYLLFLDQTRAYSHGIFLNDNEPLEVANTRKLEFAMQSCQLSPGSKILDIGTGWGCAVEYLGNQNMTVDAITISQQSANFVSNLIKTKKLLNCQVHKIDFLEYQAPSPGYYDATFSLGTLEHLPDYDQVLAKCSKLLREGGFAYFDASAINSTHSINSYFIDKHIFPGNHQCLDIYRFLDAVKRSAFDLISLHNDTHNYYLTLKTWAENLDRHKQEITNRWGESLYRKFQLYFWGCCHSMANNELQAYRVVLRKK